MKCFQKLKTDTNKLLFSLIFLFLGFLVLGISVFSCIFCKDGQLSQKVFAVEEMTVDEEVVGEPIASLTPTPVDYYLVYPGILPDHFLYPLKMIRDRIWLILTTGSKSKTEVMILFADKRLGAGKALIEGGKENLGLTTITKGEKYLEKAMDQIKMAREKNEEVDGLQEKFKLAVVKHEEVLIELKKKVSPEKRGMMDEMILKAKTLQG